MRQKTFDKILYTLKGNQASNKLKKDLEKEIKNGEIDVRECNYFLKNPKGMPTCQKATVRCICQEVMKLLDFNGFPSMYNLNGNKLY